MSTKGKKNFANKSSHLLHSYHAVNSIDGKSNNIGRNPGRSFKSKHDVWSGFVTSILPFLTLNIHRLREFLAPKLIRSFDVVPVRVKTKRF